MIRRSFCHIPQIGLSVEKKLHASGISDWETFLSEYDSIVLPPAKKKILKAYLSAHVEALASKDHSMLAESIPINDHWKAYEHFKDKCCFLDIETTGLSKERNSLTVVGIYDGKESKIFVNGQNMDEFPKEIAKYSMIVTFNGRCFDVPFLQYKFPEVNFDQFHIDLRFVMKSLGYTGGLKYIERAVGIARDDDIADVDGYEAVRLWKRYEKGDEAALKTLIDYNIADIENLKVLLEIALKELKEKQD